LQLFAPSHFSFAVSAALAADNGAVLNSKAAAAARLKPAIGFDFCMNELLDGIGNERSLLLLALHLGHCRIAIGLAQLQKALALAGILARARTRSGLASRLALTAVYAIAFDFCGIGGTNGGERRGAKQNGGGNRNACELD
jgi:hypothetical protein